MESLNRETSLIIKFVAVYLRKSRGDLEKDLEKHRKVLEEKCKENKWKYLIYEEVESGESIAMRPIMQKLMTDVDNELFDAVLVMDIDRLGRGDMGDQDRVKKVFAKSDTLVITEKEIYNLNNDDDEFIVDMKGFIARREYKEIVKRLVRGKKIGARMGMWTNGKPPYPYEYETYGDKFRENGIVVNDDKYPVYRFIIDSIVKKGMNVNEIAVELNKQKIPSPGNKKWVGTTVRRIAIDETHLGRIISNKTEGDAHKIKKPSSKPFRVLPRSEWNVVENCHEEIKTQKEHEKILVHLNRTTRAPKRSVAKCLPFTGLVKCGKCGYRMIIQERSDRDNCKRIKACWYKNSEGHKCGNSGGPMDVLTAVITDEIEKYEYKIINDLEDFGINEIEMIEGMRNQQTLLIEQKFKALSRIQEAYEGEVYTLKEFKERKATISEEIERIEETAHILELKLKYSKKRSNEDRLENILKFKRLMENSEISYQEQNDLYKTILKDIEWEREGRSKDIQIKVNFL